MTSKKVDRRDRKDWARKHFRGFENVLIPSFSADFHALDEAAIRLDVRQSIRHGFFSSMCALESGLSADEQKQMLSIAVDEAGDEIGISMSLTGENIEDNVKLLECAEAAGATHAVLSYPQGFQPASQDDVHDFVRQLADSTSLGITLPVSDKFSFHHLHPSGVPFDAYEKLADVDNIIALQVGGMNSGLVLECFERFSDRLLVSTPNLGMLPMFTETFSMQWSGPWTVEALQSPDKPYAVDFFNELLNGRMDQAMEIYWKLTPAIGSMMRSLAPIAPTGTYHWPLLKFCQWLSGGNGGMTRQPCMRLYERDMEGMRSGLRAIGIECADSNEAFLSGRS